MDHSYRAPKAELAWHQSSVVVLMPEHADGLATWQARGWKAIVAEGDWEQRVAGEVQGINGEEGKRRDGQE